MTEALFLVKFSLYGNLAAFCNFPSLKKKVQKQKNMTEAMDVLTTQVSMHKSIVSSLPLK